MDSDKLVDIIRLCQQHESTLTESMIESWLEVDWPDSVDHFTWLQSATAPTIANWIIESRFWEND